MRREVERLILQARRDLENAGKVASVGAYEVGAFLAHQAAEKVLKAAWYPERKDRPPSTHTLTELGDGLGVDARIRRHLMTLTPDYTVTRCPDAANGLPYEIYDEEKASERARASQEVLEWVEKLLRA
jgi:HEPN domain-containing protein